MMYETIVENMMRHFTTSDYESEAVSARIEFHKAAGVFDEESSDFEMKLAQFTDWYLFTRKLKDKGVPPVEVALSGEGYLFPKDEADYYRNLSNNRHSLFEFLKLKASDVHVRDLFSGYKLVIKGSKVTHGFERGQIFEARLFPHDDNFIFASAFCFHPHEATKFILKEVKKINKSKDEEKLLLREQFMEKLFRMKYKREQYRHLEVKDIYSNNSKLR